MPLPRLEPWSRTIRELPPILPKLLEERCSRQHQAIQEKGARGDGRGIRPSVFLLSCPKCEAVKDCARHRLYTSNASCVTCRECLRNTSSLKWLCTHRVQWHKCPIHREHGLWCGTRVTLQEGKGGKRPNLQQATTRLQTKRRRLGSLGQGTQKAHQDLNSALPSSPFEPKNKSKGTCRYGDRQPPKGEWRQESWASQQLSAKSTEVHAMVSPNPLQPGSSSSSVSSLVRANPRGSQSTQPPKKARLCSSNLVKPCRGNCPKVWTIELYCPNCHG